MKEITLEELKKMELELLIKIDKICKEHNLQYFLAYGTLLGAVRHKGFIPWDDDIDIYMPRNDYNKFIDICANSDDKDAHLLCLENSKDYYYPYGKFCNSKTQLIEDKFKTISNLGIYIDIFPLDEQGKTYKQAKNLCKISNILHAFRAVSAYKKRRRCSSVILDIILFPALAILNLINPRVWSQISSKVAQKYNGKNSNYFGSNVTSTKEKNIFGKDFFSDAVDIEFEGLMFKAPVDADFYLTQTYGDYMQLPPEEQRVSNHNFIAYYKD